MANSFDDEENGSGIYGNAEEIAKSGTETAKETLKEELAPESKNIVETTPSETTPVEHTSKDTAPSAPVKRTYDANEMRSMFANGERYSQEELDAMSEKQYGTFQNELAKYYDTHDTLGGQEVESKRGKALTREAEEIGQQAKFIEEESADNPEYAEYNAKYKKIGDFFRNDKEKWKDLTEEERDVIRNDVRSAYDYAEKQRGHARVFWDAVQRGFWGTGRMIYQGWEALTGGGSKESEDNIRASVRQGELEDIVNPQRVGSTSNIHNVGDALDWFTESIGENAVRGAVATGAAMAGAAAAPVVLPGVAWAGTAGAIAFGTAGTMAMNTGEAVQDQLAEEDLSGGKQKYSRGYAALQGLGYSLLDGAFGASAWAGKLWGNVLSKMGKSTADSAMRETAMRAGLGSAAKELVVHGMLGEGVQEVAQSQLVGRGRRLLQSGSVLKTGEDVSDAFLEAWDEFAGGAAAGLGMGGPAAIAGHVTAKNQYQKYTGVQDLEAYGDAFKNIGPEIEKIRQTLESDGTFRKFANFFRDKGADGRYAQMLIARHVINDHIKNSNVVDTELAKSCAKSNEIIDKEIEELRNSNNRTDRAIGDLTRSYIDIFNTTNANENFDSTVSEAQRNGMQSQFGTAGVEESVEANDDGSRDITGKDVATGISVVNKIGADGKSAGWTVVNNPNFKQPVLGDDQLVFGTQEEAVEMAKKFDLFNQARVVKNDNKVKTIRSVFNKLYGARGAKLEIIDRYESMPEGTTAAAVISPEDGSVTVKVNVDGINSIGELYNALVHERSHEDIAELIIQSNKLIGPDGKWVKDGYKRFNEIRDQLMQNVVGADVMLARAQAVAEKEGKENTWTQRTDQDKKLGRTNKGYVGEELLAERQAVNDTVAALMSGNQGLIGTIVERIQSAIKGRMAADMGLSPQAIMPSDVAKVVGVAFNRGYAGIKPKAAESAKPAEAKPSESKAENPTETETVSNPVNARQPMTNGDGRTFAPGSIIKRNSDNTVFTRTEDGKWRNDAGTDIETVDDATASEGGYTIISEPSAEDVVTADAKGGVNITGKPSDTEAKTEEKPVEKPVGTAEGKKDTAPVSENTPKTTVEASEETKTDNVTSVDQNAPEAVPAAPETKTEEKAVKEEKTPVADTPKNEGSLIFNTAKKSKRKPANKKKGNLGLTEKAAEKKEEKKEVPVESVPAKTETATEPEVKEGVLTGTATRSEQKSETKPDPKSDPKPEKNPVKKAEESNEEEAKDNSPLRISEQLKYEIGKAEKKSGLKVTDEQKQAAQRFLAENGGKVGFISKKDNVFKGALILDSENTGCCVLVSKDGRIFFGLNEYAAAISKSSENESSETKSEDSKSFQQVLRGLMSMPAGMPLQEHEIKNPSIKGLTDNAILKMATSGSKKAVAAFLEYAHKSFVDICRREGVPDSAIAGIDVLSEDKTKSISWRFNDVIRDAINQDSYLVSLSKSLKATGEKRDVDPKIKEQRKNEIKSKMYDILFDYISKTANFAGMHPGMSGIGTYIGTDESESGKHPTKFTKSWSLKDPSDPDSQLVAKRVPVGKTQKVKVFSELLHEFDKAIYEKALTERDQRINDAVLAILEDENLMNQIVEDLTEKSNKRVPEYGLLGTRIPADSLIATAAYQVIRDYKNHLPAVEKSLEYIAKRNEIYDTLGDETEEADDTSNEIPAEYKSMSGVELVKKAVEDLDLHARNEIILRYCYDNENLRKFIYSMGVKDENTVGDIIASVHEDLVRSFDYEKEDWLNSANKKNPEKSIANMATGKARMRVYAERRRMSRELLTSFAEFSSKSILFGDFSEKTKGKKKSKEQYSDPKAKELAGTIEFLKKELRTKDFSSEEKADIRKNIRQAENELNELFVGKANESPDNADSDASTAETPYMQSVSDDELKYGTSRVAKGGEGVGYKYLLRSNKEDRKRIRLLAYRLGSLLKRMSNRNYTVMRSMMEAFVEKCDSIQESIFAYQNDRLTAKQAEALGIEHVRTHHGVEEKIKKLREADIFDDDVVTNAAEKAGMYKGMYLANLKMIVADVRDLQDVEDESSDGGRIALAGLMNNGDMDYSANDVIAALKTNNQPSVAVELAEKGLSDEEIAKKVRGESIADVIKALDNAESNYGWVDPRVGTSEKSRADFVRGIEAFFRKAGYADSYGETERWLKENGYAANIEESEMLAPYRNRRQKALAVEKLVLNMSLNDSNYETPVLEWLRNHGFSDRDAKEFVEAYKKMDEDAKVLREHGAFSSGKDLLGAYHKSVLRELKKAEKSQERRDDTENRIRMNAVIDNIVASAGSGVNPESVIRNELSSLGFTEDEVAKAIENWSDKELHAYVLEERRLAKEADAKRKARLEEDRIRGEMARASKEADVRRALSTEAMFNEANRLAHEALADGLSEKDARKKVSVAFSRGGMDLDKAGEYAGRAISIAVAERARMTTEARDAEKAAQDKAYLDSLSEEDRKKVLAERAAEAAKRRRESEKFHAERKAKIEAERSAVEEKLYRLKAYYGLKNDRQAKAAYDQFEKAKVEAKKNGLTPIAYLKKELGASEAVVIQSAHDTYQKRVIDYEKSKEFEADNAVASASQPGLFKNGEEKKDAEYFTADDTRFSAAAEASRAAHGGTATSKSLKLNSTDADLIKKADRLVNDKVAMENILAMALHDKPLTPDQALALSKGSAKLRGTLLALEADQTSDHGESIRQFRDTLDKYDEAMARTGYIYGAGLRSFRIGFDISNADEHMAYLVRDLESSMKGAGLNMRKVEDPGICVDPKEKANYDRIKKEYEKAKEEIRKYADEVAKLSKELEAEHNARLAAEQRTVSANSSAEMERIKDEAFESGRASGLAEAARPITLSKEERAKLNAKYGREISDTALQAKKFIMNLLGKSVSYAGKGGGTGISSDQDIAFKAIVDQFDGDFDEAIKFFDGDKDAERMFRQWQAGLQSEVEAESDRTEKVDATVPKKERRKRAAKKIVSSGSSIFKKKVEAEQKKVKTATEKYEKKLDHLTKMLYEVLENGTSEFKATLGEFARTWAHSYFLQNPDATQDEVLESVCKQMGYQDKTRNYTVDDAKKAISGEDGYRYRTKQSISLTKAKLYKARKALEAGSGLKEVAKELGIDYTTDAEIVDAVVESLEKMLARQVESIDRSIGDEKAVSEIGKNVRRITEALHKIKTSNDKLEAVQEFVELAGFAKKYRKDMTEAERLKAQLDEWERRIDEEDFETHSRERVEPKNEAENETIRRLQMQIRMAQKNFANAKRLHQWKKMGVLGKSWTDTLDLLSMVKGIAGSLDFSSFLRQGGQMTWAHPIMAVKSFRKMLGVIKNQKMADDAMVSIMCRDTFPLMERAGIEWTEYGSGKVNYDERFIPLRGYAWFTKLKPVSGMVALSERAFAMYLNIMRANMFDYLVSHAQKKFTDKGVEGWTDEELKKIGNMINVASQRAAISGDDTVLKKSIEAANYVLWSPRNFISRIQFLKESGKLLLSYVPKLGRNINVYGKGSGNEASEKIVRDLIAKELVRYVAGVAGAILFTKMFRDLIRGEDEPPEDMVLDPRSSDFLKIKFGNTRVDYLSGLQQIMVFSSRFWTGEKTNLRGQTHKLNSRYDLAGRFLRSKFSPLGGMVWDWASGETFDRQDITWDPRKALVNNKEEISGYRYLVESTMTPLTGRDLVEQLKYTGIGPTVGTFVLTMLGAGVQAFDPYSYKQLKQDFRYFKRLRDDTNDPVERKRIEEYHPMLKRAGSIDAQIKNINRIEKDIRNIEKNGGKPGDWMLDNLEREKKRAINLMAGFRNPFDTGE